MSFRVDDGLEYMEALHAEMMAAYEIGGQSLDLCQETEDTADVEQHLKDLHRAFRLSDAYHAEADRVVLAWRAQQGGGSTWAGPL